MQVRAAVQSDVFPSTDPHPQLQAVEPIQRPARGAVGPQTVFRRASVRMCLSSDRSATSRFRRAFSSSSDRSYRSSATPSCAYFLLPNVERAEFSRVHVLEGATELADWGAGGAQNHDLRGWLGGGGHLQRR